MWSRKAVLSPLRRPVVVFGTTAPVTARAFLSRQAEFIASYGWTVHIITAPGDEYDRLQRELGSSPEVNLYSLPMKRDPSPVSDLRALVGWCRALRSINPDVVMIGTPKAGLLGILAAYVTGTRNRVYLVRGLRLEGLHGVSRALSWCTERVTTALSTNVVCVSPSLRTAMVSYKLTRRQSAVVLARGSSNGVDTARFRPHSAEDRQDARRALGLGQVASVIGVAGRVTADKGIPTLIRAFSDIHAEHPDSVLLIAGSKEQDADQLIEASRSTVGGAIRYIGQVEDMPAFFAAIDIFCLPSLREGFPNVCLEAAACGLPVVTTSATGCRDSVEHGTTGLVCAPGDAPALAAALCALLQDAELRLRLGENGRVWVAKNFRQEVVWEAVLEFLNRTVGGWSSPPKSHQLPEPIT